MIRGVLIFLLFISGAVHAQYFGRNKPHYKNFNFRLSRSPHFEIYHYLDNDSVLHDFTSRAEYWYKKHSLFLKDTIPFRNPLILYSNHPDFQQTTAIMGSIGAGTGGVTEGFKNRVIMPMLETNQQTDHVLSHELVHAFQYSLMRTSDSISIYTADVPLWMVEGMAEYMSIGNIDSHTAMWMRDAVLNNDVPTLEKMSRDPRYFPYRYGQAFWAYVAGTWGDSIIRPLFMNAAKSGYGPAIKTTLGISLDSLDKGWKKSLIDHYSQLKQGTTDLPLAKTIVNEENGGSLNVSPSISPDGRYIAFFSEKEVFTINLFLADATTGKVIRTLTSSTRNVDIDELSFLETGGAWSPDSRQYAYVVFQKGKNYIYITDVASGKTVRKIELKGLESFSSPSWSPDGFRIAVSGMMHGASDIYIYDLKQGTLVNYTNDRWSDVQPVWSPDGSYLVFSSDRATGRDPGKDLKFSFSICRLDVTSRKVSSYDIFPGADNVNPVFSASDTCFYFLSNADGFRNIFRYTLSTGKVSRLTKVFTGISGITHLSPALSISKQTGNMVFSFYNKKKYTIHSVPLASLIGEELDPEELNMNASILPPAARKPDPEVKVSEKHVSPLGMAKISSVKYRPQFKLDFIGNSGVGVIASRFGAGLGGGVNAIFSDILGNNQLFTGVSMNGKIQDVSGALAYMNQKKKLHYGIMGSHMPYRAIFTSYAYEQYSLGIDSIYADRYNTNMTRVVEDQIGLFAYYTLSQTRRIEAGTGYSFYKYQIERESSWYVDGKKIAETKEDLPTIEPYGFFNVNTAYVIDNSYFGIASPMRGKRLRYEVQQYIDGLKVYSLLADQRFYHYMKPVAFAVRGMYIGRYGEDANSIKLNPLFLGYPTLVRGYEAYSLYERNKERISIEDLSGSQIAVGNVEVRLPFTGPRRLAIINSDYVFTELAIFADAGAAWKYYTPGLNTEITNGSKFSKMKPVYSTGLSLRVNLFGMLVLEPYYALPLTEGVHSKGMFGLNFAPGW